jgi:hypothetical protein
MVVRDLFTLILISADQCARSQVAMLGATALLASSQLIRLTPGEDPTRAFIAAMAEDLEASENADEKKAADGFKAMLAAFPENEKSPVNPKINEASSAWRNRRDSNPR